MSRTLRGYRHAHGCRRCNVRYEDACVDIENDDLCTGCRGGLIWQTSVDSLAPHPCCVETARIVTKDEKNTYLLAGKHLWFICRSCARTHPFNPRHKPGAP